MGIEGYPGVPWRGAALRGRSGRSICKRKRKTRGMSDEGAELVASSR